MNLINIRATFPYCCRLLFCPALIMLLTLGVSNAQFSTTRSVTDGSTPLALSSGTGSYPLSGFDSVNLFNGSLNFTLPLLNVGGRGGAHFPIVLPIESRWSVFRYYFSTTFPACPPEQCGYNYNTYEFATLTRWGSRQPGYGPGVLQGRLGQAEYVVCGEYEGNGETSRYTLYRLTFTASDGTEYELRDQLTNGAVGDAGYPCPFPLQRQARGSVFVTSDGTSMTFISDTPLADSNAPDSPSGYLMMRDGTRYRIDNALVTWIRDRNGNRLSFTYDVNGRVQTIKDSLNRQVAITYDISDPAPYGVCDKISFSGFNGASRIIRVSKAALSTALRSGSTIQTAYQLFPELSSGNPSQQINPTVTTAVWLPNGQSYRFLYNSYAELAKVVLPTGGAFEYEYLAGVQNSSLSGVVVGEIYRRVVEKRIYTNSADSNSLTSKFTYSRPEVTPTQSTGYVSVDYRDASNNLLSQDRHYFYGMAVSSLSSGSGVEYPRWKDGKEYQTEWIGSDGATLLRRTNNTWQQPVSASTWPLVQAETSDYAKPNDPQITQTLTTLVDTNQVTKQTYAYDQYSNRTDVYEYAYGAGASGGLIRRAHTGYVTTNVVNGVTYNYDSDTAIHIRSLSEQTSVYDGAGVEQARTIFEYDNYTATANHAALVARSSISGLDAAFTTSKKTRGNATAATTSLLTNGVETSSISTYQQFDVAGNVVKGIDGLGNATTLSFSDCFGSPDADARVNSIPTELGTLKTYAFPTLVTNALAHTAYSQRDYYTGQVVDAEDVNGVTSSAYYDDLLDRPTQVIRAADDVTLHSQTSFSYDDTNRSVTTTSDLDSFNDQTPLKSQTLYDGLGRTTESRQYETATAYVTTKQTYDALGRPSQSTNPYRSGQTVVWTTTTYDALGRVLTVKTPDNATVTSSYSGNTVTATDQAGKDRKSTTDALGRLTQLVEDPGTGGLGYVTTYAYDVLTNLKTVTQGVQTRTFTYDSLSRLKSAANPESGTVNYVYDNNGNLLTRTDARSIVTTFTYDALNRPTLKNYSDTTPDVAYFYDAQTLPAGAPTFVRGSSTGRLVAVTTGGTSAGTYRGYDATGGVVRQYQRTDSINYLVEATYNKAGALLTETYPVVPGASDRRTVSYSFDEAGRLSALSSLATTYAPAASVTSVSYAPHGALASETLGNNLIHAQVYNNRLQPTTIKLGTAALPTSVMNLTYNYGTTTNNGNVQSTTYAGGGLSYTQTFGYDQLNRLTTSQEGASWSQTNSYDRYGNRSIVGGGLTFSATNNRITSAGYTYDAAGNLTNDTAHTYTYDAENKISKVDAVSAYVYDGEGNRVRKLVNENLRFIYDMGGKQIAEFDGSTGALKKEYIYGASGLVATIEPTAINSNGTRYTTSDHLGSPRVVTNSAAVVVSRHDYMPFGEELFNGGRTVGMGYGVADGQRQKFTLKERDNETGLDYFLARYFSSTQGRFTSVDPDNYQAKQDPTDPQSWNAYAYVNNNPLSRTDPDGRGFWEKLKNAFNGYGWRSNEEVQQLEDKWRNYLREQEKQAGGNLVNCPSGGQCQRVNIDALSRNDVFHYAASLKQSIENGTVQYYSKDQIDKMTGIASPIVTATGSGPNTVGQNLKNVRDIGSGRLKGYSRGNTELPGGGQAARETFRQLTGRDPAGSFDRVVQGTKEVVYRASSGSGASKIEIVDKAQKFVEKISFKP